MTQPNHKRERIPPLTTAEILSLLPGGDFIAVYAVDAEPDHLFREYVVAWALVAHRDEDGEHFQCIEPYTYDRSEGLISIDGTANLLAVIHEREWEVRLPDLKVMAREYCEEMAAACAAYADVK
jgi:hypothetical protein